MAAHRGKPGGQGFDKLSPNEFWGYVERLSSAPLPPPPPFGLSLSKACSSSFTA